MQKPTDMEEQSVDVRPAQAQPLPTDGSYTVVLFAAVSSSPSSCTLSNLCSTWQSTQWRSAFSLGQRVTTAVQKPKQSECGWN